MLNAYNGSTVEPDCGTGIITWSPGCIDIDLVEPHRVAEFMHRTVAGCLWIRPVPGATDGVSEEERGEDISTSGYFSNGCEETKMTRFCFLFRQDTLVGSIHWYHERIGHGVAAASIQANAQIACLHMHFD